MGTPAMCMCSAAYSSMSCVTIPHKPLHLQAFSGCGVEPTCSKGPTRPCFGLLRKTVSVMSWLMPAKMLVAQHRRSKGALGFDMGAVDGNVLCAADSPCASQKLPRPPRTSAAMASPVQGLPAAAASVAHCAVCTQGVSEAFQCFDASISRWRKLVPDVDVAHVHRP